MEKEALISYIENSFIKDIISIPNVTDIEYNGRYIFYTTNDKGISRSGIEVTLNMVKDFIKQIANISEKQFNYLNPILDINIGRYRINATNTSVARLVDNETITFSIRIASKEAKIVHNEEFMPLEVEELLDGLIYAHIPIVISGVPGSGKTELQKYLVSRVKEDEHIIIIDPAVELSSLQQNENYNITLWQADEKNEESGISNLIKNGLRNNPDWMIVTEARGEEMNDVLISAMTGVPIITTIHALDAFNAPSRMAKAVMLKEKRIDYQDALMNIKEHFKVFIHLKKYSDKDNNIVRYISSIVEIDESGQQVEIYSDDLHKKKFSKISQNLLNILISNIDKKKLRRFISNE